MPPSELYLNCTGFLVVTNQSWPEHFGEVERDEVWFDSRDGSTGTSRPRLGFAVQSVQHNRDWCPALKTRRQTNLEKFVLYWRYLDSAQVGSQVVLGRAKR